MDHHNRSRPALVLPAVIIAIIFGGLTLFSGGSVLFVDGAARADAGNYVPFVLWFNFLAGFIYVLAGIGLFLWRGWAVRLSWAIFAATVLVFLAFGLHIWFGGGYEVRTVGAMVLRSTVWLLIAAGTSVLWRRNGRAH